MWLDWRLLSTYLTMPLTLLFTWYFNQTEWCKQCFIGFVKRFTGASKNTSIVHQMPKCLAVCKSILIGCANKVIRYWKVALMLQETHGSFYIWLVLIGYDRLSPQLWHSSCEGCLSFHWQRWGWGMGSYLVLEGNILLFCFLIQGQICCIWVAGSSKKNF